jgi:hypothetical protein
MDANASKEERISSFNIMFSAFTESLTKPLWSPDRRGGEARNGVRAAASEKMRGLCVKRVHECV